MANSFYDDLETRSADAREAALLAALPEQIHLAQRRAPAYGRILAVLTRCRSPAGRLWRLCRSPAKPT